MTILKSLILSFNQHQDIIERGFLVSVFGIEVFKFPISLAAFYLEWTRQDPSQRSVLTIAFLKSYLWMYWKYEFLVAFIFYLPEILQLLSMVQQKLYYINRTAWKYWKGQTKQSQYQYRDPNETSTDFNYIPLDQTDMEIRLLHLCPGDEEDQICIDIIHASLLDKPRYFALSYTWGDQKDFRIVLINGQSFRVGHNLFCALRHLRNMKGPDSKIPFWIDAICINQSNLYERSQQVSFMREIYSNAYKVLVWLSTPSEDSELALAQIRALEAWMDNIRAKNPEKQPTITPTEPQSVYYYYPILSGLAYARNNKRYREPWEAIVKFLEEPWWNRAWIVQEVSSPRSLSTPLGNVEIIMGRSLQTISLQRAMSMLALIFQLLSKVDSHSVKLSFAIIRLQKISQLRRKHISIVQRIITASAALFGLKLQMLPSETLLWILKVRPMLDTFRWLKCTEPADKVYAALPLVLHPHETFAPDYSLSLSEVYAQVVKSFIKVETCLSILASRSGSDEALPSWVPDWRCLIESSPLCTRYDTNSCSVYNASNKRAPEIKISRQILQLSKESSPSPRSILEANGVLVDQISSLSPIFTKSKTPHRPEWESLLERTSQHYAPSNEPILQAYRRTLTGDIQNKMSFFGDERKVSWLQKVFLASEKLETSLSLWFTRAHRNKPSYTTPSGRPLLPKHPVWQRGSVADDTFFTNSEHIPHPKNDARDITARSTSPHTNPSHRENPSNTTPKSERIRYIIEDSTSNRVLCITSKGYIGLVPWQAKVGDQIVVLFGGHTPFILRERTVVSGLPENTKTWQLIGESYIHGFMDGEALNTLDEQDSDLKSQKFVII